MEGPPCTYKQVLLKLPKTSALASLQNQPQTWLQFLPLSSSLAKNAARQSCKVTTGPQNQLGTHETTNLKHHWRRKRKCSASTAEAAANNQSRQRKKYTPLHILHEESYPALWRIRFTTRACFDYGGVAGGVQLGQVFLARNRQGQILKGLEGYRHLQVFGFNGWKDPAQLFIRLDFFQRWKQVIIINKYKQQAYCF